MEQFKNNPRLSGLYNPKKRIVRDAAWGMAFLASVVLALVLGAIPYYDEAKMICLVAGWVMLGALAVGIAMFSGFAPTLMEGGPVGQGAFILVGFALLGLSYGQAAGAVTANFGQRYRYTGAALTSDLAWLIGAAFAPLVALGLLIPGLLVLWVGILYPPLHHSVVPHAVAMTFGGTLVGLAHLANLRLNHGHVHDATCAH